MATDYSKYRPKFNDYLDEEGEIQIGTNFAMYPSEILYEIDEIAYDEQLREYVEEKKIEYKETIIQHLPAPIAFYFEQVEHGYESEIQRLHLLRSTWESVINFSFALVVGEALAKKIPLQEIKVFNNYIKASYYGLFTDKLGWKLKAIEKILEFDRSNDQLIIFNDYITENHLDKLSSLNQERNSFAHVAALSEHQAETRFHELYPIVHDLLFEMNFLEDVLLKRFNSTLDSFNEIRFDKFDGFSLKKRNYVLKLTEEELDEIKPYLNRDLTLVEFKGERFCVSPFLQIKNVNGELFIHFFKKREKDDSLLFERVGKSEEYHLSEDAINLRISEIEEHLDD